MSTAETTVTPDTIPAPTGTDTLPDLLRHAAVWLELHPELNIRYAFLRADCVTREDMVALAAAIGPDAKEAVGYGARTVEIRGHFGSRDYTPPYLSVVGEIAVTKLGAAEPVYEPILSPAAEATS